MKLTTLMVATLFIGSSTIAMASALHMRTVIWTRAPVPVAAPVQAPAAAAATMVAQAAISIRIGWVAAPMTIRACRAPIRRWATARHRPRNVTDRVQRTISAGTAAP